MVSPSPRPEVVERDGVRFLRCDEPVDDPLALVSACASLHTSLVLIGDGCLPDAFFDLSTRFAGEFVQKMQNYGITVAAVIPPSPKHTQRFMEFMVEARRGQQFRAFEDRDAAEVWLCSR